MATIAWPRSVSPVTDAGEPFSLAPSPRTAVKHSSATGSSTTPTAAPSASSSATLTAQAGNP